MCSLSPNGLVWVVLSQRWTVFVSGRRPFGLGVYQGGSTGLRWTAAKSRRKEFQNAAFVSRCRGCVLRWMHPFLYSSHFFSPFLSLPSGLSPPWHSWSIFSASVAAELHHLHYSCPFADPLASSEDVFLLLLFLFLIGSLMVLWFGPNLSPLVPFLFIFLMNRDFDGPTWDVKIRKYSASKSTWIGLCSLSGSTGNLGECRVWGETAAASIGSAAACFQTSVDVRVMSTAAEPAAPGWRS